MKTFKKLLILLLVFAMAFSVISCGNKEEENVDKDYEYEEVFENGPVHFMFGVVNLEGEETYFYVGTDKETVGEALVELGLISGDDSEYGLYVKTVNGLTLDYDKDGKYWAFYIDSDYASSGVDSTKIVDGTLYEFKAE